MDAQTQTIISTTLSVFLIVAIGFATRRFGILKDETERSVMQLVLNVLLPCFILSKVPGNAALQRSSVVIAAMGIGAAIVVISFVICYLSGRLVGIRNEDGLKTFCVATGLQNYGFIPFPLVIGIYGDDADPILGVLFLHNLGVEIVIWTLGIVLLSGSTSGAWKRLFNAPAITIVFSLLLNYLEPWNHLPPSTAAATDVLARATDMLGLCAIPISLLLVGATLCGIIEKEKWSPDWRVIGLTPVLRFAILPAVIVTFAQLITFSPELRTMLLFQAAMPTAIFPIVLAKHYGGKPSVAVQAALVTSLLSLILTPLILAWLLQTPTPS